VKRRLSPRGAVWTGILATPVVLIAVVAIIAVATAPAGSKQTGPGSGPVATGPANSVNGSPRVVGGVAQTSEAIAAYWTPARMAAATPKEAVYSGNDSSSSTAAPTSGQPMKGEGFAPASTRLPGADLPASPANMSTAEPQSVPYHTAIPFTRFEWYPKYLVYPISTVAKMFFTQDGVNYVCSASSIAQDAAWTAGHCVNNGAAANTINGGFSYNVLVCPSYDAGVNAQRGCWGSDGLWTLTAYTISGAGNDDMGIINTTNNGTCCGASTHAGMIGNWTGWLGWAVNFSREQNWVALGYPQGAPFNGNKIQFDTSEFGYNDDWAGFGPLSVAMGNDLTGGSSGGPWVMQFGKPGQIGGLGNDYLNGHNDWKHTAFPNEMASPYFDCRFIALFNAATGSAIAC
jgi:hypothetical protein